MWGLGDCSLADAVKVTQGEPEESTNLRTRPAALLAQLRHRAFLRQQPQLPDIIDIQERDLRDPDAIRRLAHIQTPSASAGWNARTNCRRSSDFRRSNSGGRSAPSTSHPAVPSRFEPLAEIGEFVPGEVADRPVVQARSLHGAR